MSTAAPARQHPPGSSPHRGLRGALDRPPTPQPQAAGWHPVDRAGELGGTAAQLFLGFGVVAGVECPTSPVARALPAGVRLVVIGLAFGLLAAAVALSPPGRRSGAHLNPAVTLGFVLRGHTSWRDGLGYAAAQVAGAVLAAAAFVLTWPAAARAVGAARTAPQPGLPPWAAVGIEAGLTLGLLLTVFLMVSSPRSARWTPAVVTGVLSGLIWAGAPHTGASMNPARTLGPDLVSGHWPALWVYLVGPPAGALLAALVYAGVTALDRDRRTLTAKLFHDPDYPSVHATELPARPHPRSAPGTGPQTFRATSER